MSNLSAASLVSRPCETWLHSIGLPEYMRLFSQYQTLEDLMTLNEGDLKEMGVKNGAHRARMASSLVLLRETRLRRDSMPRSLRSSASNTPSNTPPSFLNHPDYATPFASNQHKHTVQKDFSANSRSPVHTSVGPARSNDMSRNSWYHGNIGRAAAEQMALAGGDGHFLIRDCTTKPGDFVLTVCWNRSVMHFVVNRAIVVEKESKTEAATSETFYRFEEDMFRTVTELVQHYANSQKPITVASGAIIRHPVLRAAADQLSMYQKIDVKYSDRFNQRFSIDEQRSNPLKYQSELDQMNLKRSFSLPNDEAKHQLIVVDIPLSGRVESDRGLNTGRQVSIGSPRTRDKAGATCLDPVSEITSDTKTDCKKTAVDSVSKDLSNASSNIPQVSSSLSSVLPESSASVIGSNKVNPDTDQSCSFTNEKKKAPNPPVKPSRVPTVRSKLVQRPFVQKRNLEVCDNDELDDQSAISSEQMNEDNSEIGSEQTSLNSSQLKQESYSDSPNKNLNDASRFHYVIPDFANMPSLLDNVEQYKSLFTTFDSKPLEPLVVESVRALLLSRSALAIAQAITVVDVELMHIGDGGIDLGLGVSSGLELLTLPHGLRLRQDTAERYQCLYLFVSVMILRCTSRDECVTMLRLWIDVAEILRSSLGNLFSFVAVTSSLLSSQIQHLRRAWLQLSREHNASHTLLHCKLSQTLSCLRNSSGSLPLQHVTVPFILPLVTLLNKHSGCNGTLKNGSGVESINKGGGSSQMESKTDLSDDDDDANNYPLEVILAHLDTARIIAEQSYLYRAAAEKALSKVPRELRVSVREGRGLEAGLGVESGVDGQLVDVMCLQTQLILLFGVKSSRVETSERYSKFRKVIQVLSEKMESTF